MRTDLQRKIDRFLGVPICRLFSLFHFRQKENCNEFKPKKILVILLSEMGSLVLAYPMFKYIKSKFPSVSVHVLLFEKNRETLEILKVVPSENIFILSNRSMTQFIRDSVGVFRKLRRVKFDTVIDCELFARISSIFSFLSGAAIRVGFHPYTQEGLYRGNFINRRVLYNPYHHISQQFITLVDAINSNTIPRAKHHVNLEKTEPPSVDFEQIEIANMIERLHKDFEGIQGKRLVLIYPSGGVLPIRAWPLEYYCQLSMELVRNGYAVGVIGLEDDKELSKVILSQCQNNSCIDLAGYTKSIRELMILFHFASLLITNDGGPGQFAAMTPIPAIVFYGPETPTLYGTLDPETVVFYSALSCSPCLTAYNHRNSPCDGDNICLKHIKPDKVIAKALEILEGQKS